MTGPGKAGLGHPWSHNHSISLDLIGAASTAGSTATVKLGNGSVRAFSWDVTGNSWKPANSEDTLTTNATGLLYKRLDDDSQWQFDTAGKLLTVTQRNGWITTYTYSTNNTPPTIAPAAGMLVAVSNNFGRTLSFKYNASSQLISVTSPDALVTSYGYDSAAGPGRLTTVSYPGLTGGTVSKTYLYENTSFPQLLTGVIDEKGVRLATYVYDAQGRGITTQHAGSADSHAISYGEGFATVTDPLGTQRTYNYRTAKGKLAVTGSDKPSGTGNSSAASRVQDVDGFVTQETDFLGVNTMYTWDINRRLPLSTTRAAGLPEVQTSTTQWHATYKLPVLVTEAGKTTAYTYDAQGNMLTKSVTDTATSLTRTATWTYNTLGLPATQTAPNGVVTGIYAYYGDTTFPNDSLLPGSYDPNMSSVGLLLHGDAAYGSTTFTDSSPSPKTVTAVGVATIGTAQSRFGGSSMYFNGINSYLDVPASADLTFGTSDYTVEFWVRFNAVGAFRRLVSTTTGGFGVSTFNVRLTSGSNFYAYNGGAAGVTSSVTAAPGVWYHVAVARQSGTMRLFVNGILQGAESSGNSTTEPIKSIGGYYSAGNNEYHNGYLDDVRITKGVARYTASFTPPTQAFPNVGPTPVIDPNAVGHTISDLQSITNAAGHVTQYTQYDRAGRVRQMIDPKGVVTETTYTPRGWISSITVTPPGGAARTSTYSYDNAGQLMGVVMPDATTLSYSYDAAHRLTGVTDTRGNTVTYTLDNMGNRVAEQVKDSQGNLQRNITRVYDALNRVQQITGASN